MEKWKPCPNFARYEVSNFGRMRRAVDMARGYKAGGLIQPEADRAGYLRFSLIAVQGGKMVHRLAHRLVMEAFTGPPPSPKHVVNHRDGKKHNNYHENLEWTTHRGNRLHACRVLGCRGERNGGGGKLKDAQVREIKEALRQGVMQKTLCAQYGVSSALISFINTGKVWAHVS